MKYSLMSHMIDQEIKLKKPTFIHKLILRDLGYQGADPTLEEAFAFFQSHGIDMKNGSLTFRDCVRFAKENGFDGLDMMAHHFDEDGREAKEILEEYGVTLSAINVLVPFTEAGDDTVFAGMLSDARAMIDRGAAAGCRNFMVMAANYTPAEGVTREETYQRLVRGLRACVAYGQEKGVTINTETLESAAVPLCSTGDMLRLFGDVPGLKYSHDTGNCLMALERPLDTYERFKHLVAAVHFKDFIYTERETRMRDVLGRYMDLAVPGEGVVDFAGHLKALRRDNYQGYITVEGRGRASNQLDAAVEALRYFRDLEKSL